MTEKRERNTETGEKRPSDTTKQGYQKPQRQNTETTRQTCGNREESEKGTNKPITKARQGPKALNNKTQKHKGTNYKTIINSVQFYLYGTKSQRKLP